MKVSIITAVRNNRDTLEDCIISVLNQSYADLEYIVIDGGSTDGSLEIIKKYDGRISEWISEPDDGIYFALNRGIRLASGDIIGFLHADDFYAGNNSVGTVVSRMMEQGVDSCYGDLLFVSRNNFKKIIRYWKSCPYEEGLFHKGWMPPHPTFFVRKEVYDKYGGFKTDFKIAADYELMLRFLEIRKISTHYIPEVLIKMRTGGASNRNLKNMVRNTLEDYRAWKINNQDPSLYTIVSKKLLKVPQFFRRYRHMP